MNTIYELLKRIIAEGSYEKGDMQNKLNVFFAVNQITQEQYLELTELINPKTLPSVKIEVGGTHEDNTDK